MESSAGRPGWREGARGRVGFDGEGNVEVNLPIYSKITEQISGSLPYRTQPTQGGAAGVPANPLISLGNFLPLHSRPAGIYYVHGLGNNVL